MNCTKCSSWRVIGPTYRRLGWGGEVLVYRCSSCGFEWEQPTHDSTASGGENG